MFACAHQVRKYANRMKQKVFDVPLCIQIKKNKFQLQEEDIGIIFL